MTTETRHADVLEFLDLNGGRCYVADLVRRGIGNDLLAELERDGLVRRDDVRIELTDRGAAAMETVAEPQGGGSEMNQLGIRRTICDLVAARHQITLDDLDLELERRGVRDAASISLALAAVVSEGEIADDDGTLRMAVASAPVAAVPVPEPNSQAEDLDRGAEIQADLDAERDEDEEETMPTRSLDEHLQAEATANGNGSTRERILALLAEHPDGLSPIRIADLLGRARPGVASLLQRMDADDQIDKVRLGANRNAGSLVFLAGEAQVPSAPDLKATTKPKPKAKLPARRAKPAAAQVEAPKPPPYPSDIEHYLGLLGRIAMIEAPGEDVIERLEWMVALDEKVRGADG